MALQLLIKGMVSSEGADLWYSHRKTTNRVCDTMGSARGTHEKQFVMLSAMNLRTNCFH